MQNTMVLRLQLQLRGTMTQPFLCDLQNTELQNVIDLRTAAPQIAAILQLQTRISTPKRKNDDFEARFKRNLQGKSSMPNQKICCQSIVGNFHGAITMRFTTLRCKTQ